ncbi:adenylyl-sulfate kinase [Conexibacter sp. JD483]|uniref:adenylyl-sulfate kinase n=1 Tax=unclassified Conexibacter TaxID=2627773 RepID=UPI00271BEF8A|nr:MULTISPECIES: adenylyl-sulfate kinase [unclassified Conexibacter]MDO8186074.1 adenylyl-sulfate kinase [Conexibacter sp. CPCC 205706]MDO8199564.1 adenylyl-sulfate kinase [Conexibacter sp. CPCC 205762]MDR9372420.1 adenylyl-sulfate kinase [Conexibacter sp. JD483]
MRSANVVWHEGAVSRDSRWRSLRRTGATIWLTGLPAAGKSTLADALERALLERGRATYRLDATAMRGGVCADLGYTAPERRENNRRMGELARLFADAGTIAIVAAVSPFAAGREAARELHERDGLPFVEVWVNTPQSMCAARDPYGVYRAVADHELRDVPGLDLPYEPPTAAEVEITPAQSTAQAVEAVSAVLTRLTAA